MLALGYLARLDPDAEVTDRDDADTGSWFWRLSEEYGDQAAWEVFERAASAFPELQQRLAEDRWSPLPSRHSRPTPGMPEPGRQAKGCPDHGRNSRADAKHPLQARDVAVPGRMEG